MKYALLRRDNLLVDILDEVRYIKLQPSNGIVVSCGEGEGTGVIGSDANTHFTLIKSDMQNNPDAVYIIPFKTIPSYIKPYKYKYESQSQSFVDRYTLDEAKALKQEENKVKFAEYLATHPLTWTDGKQYGITQEDQNEINLNLSRYQIAAAAGLQPPTLEWHAKHEENKPWSAEKLTALSLDISATVYPIYHKMQQYKTAIYDCTSIDQLNVIELNYE